MPDSEADPHPGSLARRLRQRFGEEVDARVDLDLERAEPTSASSSAILERLGQHAQLSTRYELRGEIARGGMGVILEVWDPDLRRKLAMKVALAGDGTSSSTVSAKDVDPRLLARFLEEAQVTGQLDHPGIVPVHELGLDENGRVYFTMRLVRGRDLRAIFELAREQREGWTTTRALGVVLRACEAVGYAHARSVIHRDLKPANVMVGRHGEVYVMDWGLARVLGVPDRRDLRLCGPNAAPLSLGAVHSDRRAARESGVEDALYTMDGDIVGTPSYMAPEQARGAVQELDARADVYSMGAMLYHLLAGQIPFVPSGAQVSPRSVLMRLLEGPPPPLAELAPHAPPELVAICERAMQRDPARRYASLQELAEDLRAYLEGRVVQAYEAGAVAELRKWVKRNRGLASSLAATGLIAFAGLAAVGLVQARGRRLAEEKEALAVKNGVEARRQEGIARRERANVLRLSATQKLLDMRRETEGLWPAVPATIPAYEDWLRRADALVAGLDPSPSGDDAGFRAQLAELRARGQHVPGTDGGEWVFAGDEDRWWHGQLSKLVADIEAFGDPSTGQIRGSEAVWSVAGRLAFAREVEERTLRGAEARAAWSEACASIRDPARCPRYAGLELEPQIGLLPLGRDPDSGLWEFVHVQSGEAPTRGADGRLAATGETGIVLVLVPGGTFDMGAQRTDPAGANYDPDAEPDEVPVQAVALAPFFVSKFELTQGQWRRATGLVPSSYASGRDTGGRWITDAHPVENVRWTDCQRVLASLGLSLPTEAQWEYAARGGTRTPWSTGAERQSLQGAANLCDSFAQRAGAPWRPVDDWLDDGYAVHAAVGCYAPNPFGLHDVHGNAREWCRDVMVDYHAAAPRPGDGLRAADAAPAEDALRARRGGDFYFTSEICRSANRDARPGNESVSASGARPARPVE